jgi:superfamily II DNA or RNA helicase
VPVAAIDLTALRDAIHDAASQRAWSQGVTLARDDRVVGRSSSAGEIEVEVRAPARPTPFTAVLYPEDGEWECDCSSRERACAHVVAAVLAVGQAREAGDDDALPTSAQVGGALSYRMTAAPGGLNLERWVVHPDGREERLDAPLQSILSGRVAGPRVAAHDVDLLLDRLLASRPGAVLSGDRLDRLLGVLADAADLRLAGAKVQVSGELVTPRATLEDHADGVRLTIARDPAVDEVVSFGVVRVGDVLRPVGETELGGGRLEKLPVVHDYGAAELTEVAATTLPALAARMPVDVRTDRLPPVGGAEIPRVVFDVVQRGETLSVMATVVYGDPPRARLDGDRLTHLGGELPLRDPQAERQLLYRLRDRLHLAPGRRVEVGGKDAIAMNAALAEWLRADARAAGDSPAAVLIAEVAVRGGRLDVTFAAGSRRAATDAVIRAWQAGADLVALEGGGWGQVPAAWLARHGTRVADLLAACAGGDRVPMHALPDLGRLCEDLDLPSPPDLARLRPLIEGFDGLPRAALPPGMDEILRPYQRIGVDWLAFSRDAGLGCVLADDMGLGKTVQALAAMRGRVLVVCPTSVVWNWAEEARRFRPDLEVALYHGSRRKLDDDADLTLTSYPLLRNDIDVLAAIDWDVVILDESQTIKNPDSQVARAAYKLRAGWRVTLSGTPVENRLDELWSQIHFTNPGLLGGRADFAERWAAPVANGDPGAAARLRERIRPFVLRRKKADVAPELPPRTEAVLHVELDGAEREVYDAIRAATQRDLLRLLEAGGGVMAALEALLRLRQASCHRALVPGQSAASSSKVEVLIEALGDAAADGHKALVFSQWTSLLDLIEPHLEAAGIAFTRLDGSTRDRAGVVAEFQADDGPPVMLISLKAGGTGLNLTAADHVFLVDPWWNPAVEDQAADRAHRIGQDKPVMVYRLVALDTVEERILALQASKRALADAALGDADRAASMTRDDLLALLR